MRTAVIAAAVVALLAAAFWSGHLTSRSAPPPAKRILKLVRLTWEPGQIVSPNISPDGASFLYVTRSGTNLDILLRRIGGDVAINLTKDCPDADLMPAFAPDGQSIAFRSERDGGGIFLMGPTGESVRRLTDFGFDPTWSPDGKSIALSTDRGGLGHSVGDGEIWIVDVATGARRKIFAGNGVHPSWSPAGSRIAFHWSRGPMARKAVATIPASGGEPVTAAELDGSMTSFPVWTPDGIIFCSTRGGEPGLWRVAVNERTGAAAGDQEPVLQSPLPSIASSATADGRRILFSTYTLKASLKSYGFDPSRGRVASAARDILTTPRQIMGLCPSPNGEWVAAVLFDQGRLDDTVLINSSTGELRRVTHDDIRDQPTGWSADGAKLYLQVAPAGEAEIWSIRPDGSERTLVARGNGIETGSPSSDGRSLYALIGKRREASVIDLTAPLSQRKPVPFPAMADGRRFSLHDISPDGRWAVGYPIDEKRDVPEPVLWLFDIAEKRYRQLADLKRLYNGQWLPDSRRILLWREGEVMKVFDRETGTMTPAGGLEAPAVVALSGDGRSLFMLTRVGEGDIWMLEYENTQAPTHPQKQAAD